MDINQDLIVVSILDSLTGFKNYPVDSQGRYLDWNDSYYNGFCSCGSGMIPIYSPTLGLGCMNIGYTDVNQSPYYNNSYNYNYWNTNTWDWRSYSYDSSGYNGNRPQYPYTSPFSQTNGCYENAMQVCDLNVPGACGYESTCRPFQGGSNLGACVRTPY